ncbi:hypothetical protein [Mesorhizobium sp.]|uniref:hypothetical protein n=1 Tax=Mesorhizobium sp. TaxID=1871066 RepID=UPI0025DC5D36|nr:hypothetical protein [Mesorhizobium sp.]
MKKFVEYAVANGKKYAVALAAVAAVSMVSGCQSTDTTKTGAIAAKPLTQTIVKKVYYTKKKQLHRGVSKPVTQMTNVTRVREEAYAIFVRPQRIRTGSPVKVSYTLGEAGPLFGHSPWICGPSGFGQRASCRAR